ncbi:MAG: glycoside hydrolase family 127 protein [Anaerolineae bacterium]|jgi:DUF1680 family protein
MQELDPRQARIADDFWSPRLETNARDALDHQWAQLVASGCIENFRLAAGQATGFRKGWFFADSDAYKWLDAAARASIHHPRAALSQRMDAFVTLLAAAQQADGYLYTYNQRHFPETRWANLQIEHELYCHGHLIEAALAHFEATGRRDSLALAERVADLLVRDFAGAGPEATPGHQEVEIALLRLHRVVGNTAYLDLADQFVEQRGRIHPFAPLIYRQNAEMSRRMEDVARRREAYAARHPVREAFKVPPGNAWHVPGGMRARYYLSALSGRYFQQHRPVREQRVPVGHAVRFTYLETAVAMLHRARGDETLLPALEAAWAHMVGRRMYVTGGIGSLPEIEGFGRDYELDPEYAYAETCAALGSMFWNWEMALNTGQAHYADLFEWQLYNAASVGMGLDGRSYLYNNPLASRGGVTRRAWYAVPCCPSNLSRTWAWLGRYVYAVGDGVLWVQQYIGNEAEMDVGVGLDVVMESGLPWEGAVRLRLSPARPTRFTLNLRVPSWADACSVLVNGEPVTALLPSQATAADPEAIQPASGYAPQRAWYLPIERTWSQGDVVELNFSMSAIARRAHPRVRSARGRVALTRGPLVYCLESIDNPGIDLFADTIEPGTVRVEPDPGLFDGIRVLRGKTAGGHPFTAIPYSYWANRGESQMAVWLRA